MHGGRRNSQGCAVDMTPMIDVVFQLIIFFVVAINLTDRSNPDIRLAKGPNGERLPDDRGAITVEVDRKGRLSIGNFPLSPQSLRCIVQARYNRMGQFPVLIRSDTRTRHEDVRKVMDMCSGIGLHRVWFAAIKEERARLR